MLYNQPLVPRNLLKPRASAVEIRQNWLRMRSSCRRPAESPSWAAVHADVSFRFEADPSSGADQG